MVQPVAPFTLITSYSLEGVFFGMNCVLYAFCVYTLWGQKSISCRLLLFINSVQFLLCTTQLILHAILYFIVFTVHVGDIQPFLSHVNAYIVGHTIIFNINFIIAGILSIWRLCVLYDKSMTVCIPAFIVWIAQLCASAITIHICATTPVASTSFSPVNMLLWVLISVLNLYVAIQICIRLCITQQRTHTILGPSSYRPTAIVLVECGALIIACSVAMMILYACNYIYAWVGLGIATEIAVASQLLVAARHGLLSQGRYTLSSVPIALRVNTMQTECSQVDPPTELVEQKTLDSIADSEPMTRKDNSRLMLPSRRPP